MNRVYSIRLLWKTTKGKRKKRKKVEKNSKDNEKKIMKENYLKFIKKNWNKFEYVFIVRSEHLRR